MSLFHFHPGWLLVLAFHLSTQSVGMYSGGVQLLFVMLDRIAGEFAINVGWLGTEMEVGCGV